MTFKELMDKYQISYTGYIGEVREGWFDILDRLIPKLIELGWDKELHQVKEKFGGLRFYIGKGSTEIWEAIDTAERESLKVCEVCGSPGKCGATNGGYWILTLCPKCREIEDEKWKSKTNTK